MSASPSSPPMGDLAALVARTCSLPESRVRGAVDLLAEGGTVPFIARYRKERTGGLDETQIRAIEDSLAYFRELDERKATVRRTIEELGRLTPELASKLDVITDRKELEDLYLPYKPKRRTRATIARERGLESLADYLRAQENGKDDPDVVLARYVSAEKGVEDAASALAGACDILAEEWADRPDLRVWVRALVRKGRIASRVRRDWKDKTSKFETYYTHDEPVEKIPSHRYLAMRRGEAESVLSISIEVEEEKILEGLTRRLVTHGEFRFRKDLEATVRDAYTRLMFPSVQNEILAELKKKSDDEAIAVFATNLRELLLSPPAGPRVVLGIDPGFRTGCKVVVIDRTGKFLVNTTIFPSQSASRIVEAETLLCSLIRAHSVELIAIGNGTGSRETDAFVSTVLKKNGLSSTKVMVNESGASIYSASEVARDEFPDLDLTVRGAISIARRLQDPLAELVKIDPKSIGVGQYQHDVDQRLLKKELDRQVESCVNGVGVDVNTASKELLSYVAGLGPSLAGAIVKHRDANGAFRSRDCLRDVPRLGAKAFEQCAGFLRIRGGDHPLDNSAVHPEAYTVVEKIATEVKKTTASLVGDATSLRGVDAQRFVDAQFGLPTIKDILAELEKPGRDPRKEFRVATFAEGVNALTDLVPGMMLEGVVTNVTHFGAFVDIGVHQDGLVHISELDRRYVENPAAILAVGDIVKVKVMSIDVERKRIALSRKAALDR